MKPLKSLLLIIGSLFVASLLILVVINVVGIKTNIPALNKNVVLKIDLTGVIIESKDFIRKIRYAKEEHVKAVVIEVNSPGGVVGASQAIYSEILRVRKEYKKPVIVSVESVAASGAYYAAIAADKIITNPGSIMGSIGVIMEFAEFKDLYKWMKIKIYTLKSGSFKDAGGTHRSLSEGEKRYFQLVIDNIYNQFKKAVQKHRNLSDQVLEKYTDGRVFSGEVAVELGFADQVGTLKDAIRIAGEMSGLGKNPKVFIPKKPTPSFLEILSRVSGSLAKISPLSFSTKKMKLLGQPLFLMPGGIE